MTHYEALGVPRSADLATIRRAYRSLARATHPDLGGDPTEFAAIALAWSVLSDRHARAEYDASIVAGDDEWGEEVGLGEPAPKARSSSTDTEARSGATGDADAAGDQPPGDPVDPFTSPPRALPSVDTSGVVRHYPRPIGEWLFLAYCAAALVAVAVPIALKGRMPISSAAYTGFLLYSCMLMAALALRSLAGGRAARAFSATVLYGLIAAFSLGGTMWTANGLTEGARVTRAVIAGSALALSLVAAAFVDVRRARARRITDRLRKIHDDAMSARRWNVLLHQRLTSPGAEVVAGEVAVPGRRRPVAAWAVVDPTGLVLSMATDDDLDAWCAALRSAGLRVRSPHDRSPSAARSGSH